MADYFVLAYTFSDGRDLDTRTAMLKPSNSAWTGFPYENPIGNPPFIEWGGDNTGTGHEAVLINIPNFKSNYPGETELTIDLRAQWISVVGKNPVVILATSYVGGTMVKNGFSWNNPTATNTYIGFSSVSKVFSYFTTCTVSDPGERVATMTINFAAGVITYGN
eukprot:scaffold92601_cov75-Cyclotella_meneghiniana.AAC.6